MYQRLVHATSKPSAKNYTLDFLALPDFFGNAAETLIKVVMVGIDPALMFCRTRRLTPDARASSEMLGAVLIRSMILLVSMTGDCMRFFVRSVY